MKATILIFFFLLICFTSSCNAMENNFFFFRNNYNILLTLQLEPFSPTLYMRRCQFSYKAFGARKNN